MTCNHQSNLPMPGILDGPGFASDAEVSNCDSMQDAILLCWQMRRVKFSQAYMAAQLEIPAAHLSNILNGKKYLPPNKMARYMALCGNYLPMQYLARSMGLELGKESLESRCARLERELEDKRRAERRNGDRRAA